MHVHVPLTASMDLTDAQPCWRVQAASHLQRHLALLLAAPGSARHLYVAGDAPAPPLAPLPTATTVSCVLFCVVLVQSGAPALAECCGCAGHLGPGDALH